MWNSKSTPPQQQVLVVLQFLLKNHSPIITSKVRNIRLYLSSFINSNNNNNNNNSILLPVLLRFLFLIAVVRNTITTIIPIINTTTTTTSFPLNEVAVPVVFVSSFMVVRPIVYTGRRQYHPFLLLDHSINTYRTKSSFHTDCPLSKMSSSFVLRSTSSTGSSSSTTTTNTNTESYIQVLSNSISNALGRTVELEMTTGGGGTGGSGATTFVVRDQLHPNRNQYFVKSTSNSEQNQQMMYGEYCSIQAIDQTNTIRVPKPIAYGNYIPGSRTFVIFEYLNFASSSSSSQYTLGQQLAKLHFNSIPKEPELQQYGFHVNNTIGATFQPNLPYYTNWTDFYIHHRLNHMLQLTNSVGMSDHDIEALRNKVRHVLQQHTTVQPSLVHGDLWGGNKGFCYDTIRSNNNNNNNNNNSNSNNSDIDGATENAKDRIVVPCIFDPASYYGDREVDIAMTYVFGGFSSDFYQGYNDTYPLASGHESRRIIYNLYHILNHDVLFGGGYRNQARNMIYEILRM